MSGLFTSVRPTEAEVAVALAGDDIIPDPDVVMDRAFTLAASPEKVWPWFVQLGKNRAGWYFPASLEWVIPRSKRGLRHIDKELQDLRVGKIIDDWGGKHGYFKVARLVPPHVLVHTSTRGNVSMSWAIVLRPEGRNKTRVHLRLRLAPVRHKRLANYLGGSLDLLTIVGLAAGLRERLR